MQHARVDRSVMAYGINLCIGSLDWSSTVDSTVHARYATLARVDESTEYQSVASHNYGTLTKYKKFQYFQRTWVYTLMHMQLKSMFLLWPYLDLTVMYIISMLESEFGLVLEENANSYTYIVSSLDFKSD
jgi:hypothetical protein